MKQSIKIYDTPITATDEQIVELSKELRRQCGRDDISITKEPCKILIKDRAGVVAILYPHSQNGFYSVGKYSFALPPLRRV